MKITEIRIARFGKRRNLTLPVPSRGLNVVYGPNEAGKSTLMRFIRGVLYGFDPFGPERPSAGSPPCGGTLRIDSNSASCLVSRTAQRGSRGLISVATSCGQSGAAPGTESTHSTNGEARDAAAAHSHQSAANADETEQQVLDRLLAETDEKIFDNVFAVGLHELQELATLHDDAVARHIYGLSLGPDGRRLLEVTEKLDGELKSLLDVDQRSGEIVDLLLRHDELLQEIDAAQTGLDRYRELKRDAGSIEIEIADLKARHSGIESQLRGHQFLERVWGPWDQVRQYKLELDKLPLINGFPENGLKRLDALDDELGELGDRRAGLEGKSRDLKARAAVSIDRGLHRNAAAMRHLVDQRELIVQSAQQHAAWEAEAERSKRDFDQVAVSLGPNWKIERIAAFDASPAAHRRLSEAARRYEAALFRRRWLRKRYRTRAAACQRRLAEHHENLKSLGGIPLQQAMQAALRQIRRQEDLDRAVLRETTLAERSASLESQIAGLQTRLSLPKWVNGVFAVFSVVGATAVALGLIVGAVGNVLAGLMWTLLGCTCALLAWAMKTHYDGAAPQSIDRLKDEAADTEIRLRETRQTIERLTKLNHGDSENVDNEGARLESGGDSIAQARKRIAQLEQWSALDARLLIRRKQLSALRSKLQQEQRELTATRLAWCQALTEIGLSETVRVSDGFDEYERVFNARQLQTQWERARADLESAARLAAPLKQQLETVSRRLERPPLCDPDAAVTLMRWEQALSALHENREIRRRLRGEKRALRREIAGVRKRIHELNTKRAALLVQGGAATREEFEKRAKMVVERNDVVELLELANAELDAAAETEPELAVAQEDLLDFDADQNRHSIEVLECELGEIKAELEHAFEKLGGVRQMVKSAEAEETSADLRLERGQLESRIQHAAEEWLALQLAARNVAQMKSSYERNSQPATLGAASSYLTQLTAGRYTNVWTPLGERHLCVDDGRRQTFRVEQLSNGTREQLFLAIRLALVRQFAGKGISLPIVLDDVIVNFDQARTEAAVDTLLNFAAREQQQVILFTCHLHLAQLFESRGIEPIRLPSRDELEVCAAG